MLAAPTGSVHAHAHALRVGGIEHSRISIIPTDADLDTATALTAAATAARAEHLVLMQTPAMGLTHDRMTRLVGYCTDPAIAAAGPVVLSTDGRIERAGVAITGGIPLFLLHGLDGIMGGPTVLNVSAVSGVVATAAKRLSCSAACATSCASCRLSTTACAREVPGCALSRSPTRGFGPSRRMDQSTI